MSEEGLQKAQEVADVEEIKDLIEEDIELAKENNKLLKRLHRNALIALIAKVVLWIIILGIPLYFLGPYLGTLFSIVSTGQIPESGAAQNLLGVPTAEELKQLLNAYTGQ